MCMVALLFCVSVIQAQTVTGSIKGNVTDTSGALVPGVSVEIINVETGLKRTLETTNDGTYEATFLPLGRYKVTVNKSGFGTIIRENIEVTLNQTTAVDFKMDPSVTATVTIDEEPPQVNTTNAQIAGTLSSQQITERPVANQGNFLTLAETFTGYQENPTSGQNNPTSSSGSSINFNGTGSRGATFQINGVNNDDSSENQNRQGASLATIKEFQVITNNFTAEFGRGYGAVVLVQTKAGTNSIRGETYLYHNDSALNAKSFYAHGKKAVNRRNQFGGVVGFPIFKNKLFGFLSLDHVENSGANNYTRDIFLASEKNPANWFAKAPENDTPANRAFIQSVIDRFPSALVPNDSRSPRTYTGVQGYNFPARDYSARFDWNASESDTLFARWQYTRQILEAEDIIVGERADQNNKQQNYGLTWTHLFSPQLVGEFRYGLGLRTTLVNITAGNDTPVIRFFNPNAVSGTIIGNATSFPIQRYQTDNQFVYNLSWNVGTRHFLKLGTDIRVQRLDDLADAGSRGFYNFTLVGNLRCNGVVYTSGFDSLINGCVNSFSKAYGPFFLENRLGESNFYAEDNWKVRPNLTLNIGLRYEYVKATKEKENRVNYGIKDDKNNIEPRVGFAYSPSFSEGFLAKLFGPAGNSSIRAGYGMYHGRIFQSVFSQGTGATLRFNPPNAFNYSQTGTATDLFNPVNLEDPTRGFKFVPGEPTVRYSIAIPDPNLEVPYTQQWNMSFERQIPWNSAIRLTYSGNRGIGLLRFVQDNLPIHDPVNGVLVPNHPNNPANLRGQIIRLAADAQCAGTTGTTAAPFTTDCPVVVPIGALEYSARVPRVNERRPDGRYGTNLLVGNGSWSYYHGLQVELNKRLSNNINFQVSYTFSKAIDTTSEATNVGTGDSNFNGPNSRVSRGFSRFHSPHRFTFFGTYRMPFFDKRKDWIGQVIGGWQLSTVVKLIRGTPFTVSGTSSDLNFDGVGEVRPVILDPRILGNSISNPETSQQMLPRSAFRSPTLADFGCCILGRNTFFLDGIQNVDFGLSKSFPMPFEGHFLRVRADFFNAFNHVQYGFPNATYTSASLGVINTTATQYAPRNIQVSLRYTF